MELSARAKSSAFSLLELSIVLVIIGLLTGGVLAGKSLIRGSEMQTVMTELGKYSTAVQSFRNKYMAVPGDFKNAQSFWGVDGNSPTCAMLGAPATSTTGTCNGNGDGNVDSMGVANGPSEMFQFWKQLSLANLIEGRYTGYAYSGYYTDSVPGTNIPKSHISNASWGTHYIDPVNGHNAASGVAYSADYGNVFTFGATVSGSYNNYNYVANLKPEEAWKIDSKLDDGMPGTGSVIARSPAGWNNAAGTLNKCTLSTGATDTGKGYALSVSSVQCTLYFAHAF